MQPEDAYAELVAHVDQFPNRPKLTANPKLDRFGPAWPKAQHAAFHQSCQFVASKREASDLGDDLHRSGREDLRHLRN